MCESFSVLANGTAPQMAMYISRIQFAVLLELLALNQLSNQAEYDGLVDSCRKQRMFVGPGCVTTDRFS